MEEVEKEIGNTKEQDKEAREDRIRKEVTEAEIQPKKMFRCFYCAVQFSSQKGHSFYLAH